MSTVTVPASAPASPLTPNVDFEVLRAQLVNCVLAAAGLLGQHNPGISAHCIFNRFLGLGLLFTLNSAQFESRRYLLRLVNPDGTQANLVRLSAEGGEIPLDEVDTAYLNALGHCMESTVHAAWKQMVPVEPKATHSTNYSLH
jgi:hypothetical protein